jgi:lipopolysaccharide/colanic/teichoic acid biosynthesis glycosyltransferase
MAISEVAVGLPRVESALKRIFDFTLAFLGLLLSWWLIALAWFLATVDTRQNGFFTQERVGRFGKRFRVVKIRTMRTLSGFDTSVTTAADPRVTRLGSFFRRTKIDELPQLINVLVGQMSFVGPRPDVPGFADSLRGKDRVVLTLRPGITGPATLIYRDEEALLARQKDPERFNREVIFPDKVRINVNYIECYRFRHDLKYIWQTVFGGG